MKAGAAPAGQTATIRRELFAVVGFLMAGLVIVSLMGLADVIDHRSEMRKATLANHVGDRLFSAAKDWAVERGATHLALNAAGPADEKTRAAIAARRAKAHAAFAEVIGKLGRLSDSALQKRLVADIQAALKKVKALRRAAERQLGLARGERDGAVAAAWFPAMTALIQAGQDLRLVATDGFDMDLHTHRLGAVKHFAWMAAEFAGRERAIVGGAIATGAGLTPEQLNILSGYRGNVDTAWRMISDTAAGDVNEPGVARAVEDAAAFFTDFEATRRVVYGAGRKGGPYPMTAAAWFERATDAIDALVAVQVAAGDARRIHLDELLFRSGLGIVAGVLVLAAALAAGAAAFWIVGVRVMGPLSAMTGVMGRLAGGELDTVVPDLDRKDEIGAMARALEVFREHARERRRAEEELRKTRDELEIRVEERTSELRLMSQRERAILEHAAEGIITSDENGLIETFNPMAERLFGYKAEEVIGKNLNMLMAGDDARKHDGYIDHYLETGVGKILGVSERELFARRKDGSLFPFELNVAEFHLGDQRRFIGTIRDITQRKKAQEETRRHAENQRLLQAVAQAANEARTVEVAMKAGLKEVCAHTGWSVGHAYLVEDGDPERLVSSRLWYFDDPERFETFRRVTEKTAFARGEGLPGRVFSSGEAACIEDLADDANFLRFRNVEDTGVKSGFAFPVPVQGRVGAVLEFFSDEIQEIDERFLKVMDQIGIQIGQVIERNKALEQLAEAMEETDFANKAKTEFLANMSHELRTPLNSILGFSEVVRDEVFGPLGNKRYLEYMGNIHSSGEHLLDLINDILDVSKVEAGAMDLSEEIIDVKEVVRDSMKLVEGRAEKVGVGLVAEIDENLPRLRADSVRVKQILINLLSNAVKFTPGGGVITVEAGVDAKGDMVVSIADTGIGIAEDEIKDMLEPFTQASSGAAKRHEGTGLGLYLVKTLVEEHGGFFEMESALGRGTKMTLRFPRDRIIDGPGPLKSAEPEANPRLKNSG